MARTVADTALLLSASVGLDARDPLSYPVDAAGFSVLRSVDLSTLRIGTTEDFGLCIVDPEIRCAFRERVEAIRPWVARCEPVALELGDADRAFDVLRAESFIAAFADTCRREPRADGQWMRNYYHWLALTYVVTLATNPALSLPCGRDEHGMPFRLQVIADCVATRSCWPPRMHWSRPSPSRRRCGARVPTSPHCAAHDPN